jgi:integrase
VAGWTAVCCLLSLTRQSLRTAEVTERFVELTRQARLPPIRLHDLRRGAATLALAAGADLNVVSSVLRHSSITVTMDLHHGAS